jgi:hypothetical protein
MMRAGCAMAFCSIAGPAWAHTSERGQVMLLPTELYVAGGAAVVAASVVLVALLPLLRREAVQSPMISVLRLTPAQRAVPSLAGLAMLAILIMAGFLGPPDPIANPLPGAVWTLWWTALTILTIAFGNLWAAVNPWSGLYAILRPSGEPLVHYPSAAGQWPAVVLFLAFAWFELVYPTPFDPIRLATVLAAYVALTFAGLFLFGRVWLEKAECFSVYFRMVAWLSPLQWRVRDGGLCLRLVLPGTALGGDDEGQVSGAFILLALSTVSFDGFMRTFFWAGVIGFNPLEYPGRSALIGESTVGLLAMYACLAAGFWLAMTLGRMLAPEVKKFTGLVGSIVPIALAYHLAHYLPDLPIGLMQEAKALSDPFGTGLDLFGTANLQPPASLLMDHHVAELVYRSQTAIIVAGHVIAVAAAHAMAAKQAGSARAAILGLLPLNAAMVVYTMFGLWLLSTPVVG